MADSFKAKQITSLTENTSMADTDIVPVGNAGTSTLRRIKWANILEAIKSKITSWTYSFNTSSKTLEGAVNEMQGNISAINGSLSNISGTATPVGIFKNQSISYMRGGRIVVVTGWVNTGSVQDPTTGYPEGNHYTIASIPYTPLGGAAPLAAYCMNGAADAQVWVENGNIVFKSTRDPFSNAIYVSGAFIMA